MAVAVVNEKQMSLFVLFQTKDRMLQKTGILSGIASDEELWRRSAGLGNLINPLTHQHTAHVWQHEEWKTRKSGVGMSLSSRLVLSIPSLWGVLFLAFSPPLRLFIFSSFFLQTLRNATNHPSRLNPRQPFWTLTFGLFGFPEYCSHALNKKEMDMCLCCSVRKETLTWNIFRNYLSHVLWELYLHLADPWPLPNRNPGISQ